MLQRNIDGASLKEWLPLNARDRSALEQYLANVERLTEFVRQILADGPAAKPVRGKTGGRR